MPDISDRLGRSRIDKAIREEEDRLVVSLHSRRTRYQTRDDLALAKVRNEASKDYRRSALKISIIFLGLLGVAMLGHFHKTWKEMARVYDAECIDENPFKTVEVYGYEISCQRIEESVPDSYLE